MRTRLELLVRAAARRPGRTLVVCALIAALGGVLALRLEPSAATDTLVGRSTESFKATERLHEKFGDDAIFVLARGPVQNIVLTENLNKLIGLEGCLSGNAPADVEEIPGGAGGPCDELRKAKPVEVVFGPGTFINTSVTQISEQIQATMQSATTQAQEAAQAAAQQALRRGATRQQAQQVGQAAGQQVRNQILAQAFQLATQYGIGLDAVTNPSSLIPAIVFDSTKAPYTPKERFAYLFPNQNAALVTVRLKADLEDEQRERAIGLIRDAVAMDQWRPTLNVNYLVSGAPVVVNDVTADLTDSLIGLLVGGVLMMAFVLPLVFRGRARMLPLAVALGAAGVVFGLMSLLGVRLTLASIAVLPVLLGLGVDYAIQYQARLQEDGVGGAIRYAVPAIGTALVATVAGFAVLLLSPVPMVRGFGVVLMAGVVVAYVLALTAGTSALVALARRGAPRAAARRAPARAARAMWAALAASGRGAGDILHVAGRPFAPLGRLSGRIGRAVVRGSMRRPVLVLSLGAVLAATGLAVDSKTEVVSDIRELVPRDLPAVADIFELQEATKISGEIDVLVEADDLTDPEVLTWMRDYQERLAERFDYSAANGCGEAEVCPAFSLPDLFRTPEASADQDRVRALLDAVPDYFSRAVLTEDRTAAAMAFGIRLMPLDRQKEIVDIMRAELDPPEGVSAELAGLPVLAAEANDALSDPGRRLLTLVAGLVVVLLALLLVYRRWRRAWVPLVPIALAVGWSALVLWLTDIPLNPMSATLGALVIAISTEFSVLLVARFEQERAAGHDVATALERTYASTGMAVLASGVTAIAGFAVLAFSDVQMLKDFGRVTVVDLTVSLLGVLAVLPAVLALTARGRPARLRSKRRTAVA